MQLKQQPGWSQQASEVFRPSVCQTEFGVGLDKCLVNTCLEESVMKELQRLWIGESVSAAEEALEWKRKQTADQRRLNTARDPREQIGTQKWRSTGFESSHLVLTKYNKHG